MDWDRMPAKLKSLSALIFWRRSRAKTHGDGSKIVGTDTPVSLAEANWHCGDQKLKPWRGSDLAHSSTYSLHMSS